MIFQKKKKKKTLVNPKRLKPYPNMNMCLKCTCRTLKRIKTFNMRKLLFLPPDSRHDVF